MRENKVVENVEYDNQNDKDDTTKMQIGKMMKMYLNLNFKINSIIYLKKYG